MVFRLNIALPGMRIFTRRPIPVIEILVPALSMAILGHIKLLGKLT